MGQNANVTNKFYLTPIRHRAMCPKLSAIQWRWVSKLSAIYGAKFLLFYLKSFFLGVRIPCTTQFSPNFHVTMRSSIPELRKSNTRHTCSSRRSFDDIVSSIVLTFDDIVSSIVLTITIVIVMPCTHCHSDPCHSDSTILYLHSNTNKYSKEILQCYYTNNCHDQQ